MKHITLFFCLCICTMFATAQKKERFFQSPEISTSVYSDNVRFLQEDWPRQIRSGNIMAARYDTFSHALNPDRSCMPRIRFQGIGIKANMLRYLPVFKHSNTKLIWSVGLGLRSFDKSDYDFDNDPYFWSVDTASVRHNQRESFHLHQFYLDGSTSLRLERQAPYERISLYAGVGLGFSTSFVSKIRETLDSSTFFWSTPAHTFVTTPNRSEDAIHEARASQYLTFNVPFGFGFTCGRNSRVRLGMEYIRRWRTPALGRTSCSEGVSLNAGFEFKL